MNLLTTYYAYGNGLPLVKEGIVNEEASLEVVAFQDDLMNTSQVI